MKPDITLLMPAFEGEDFIAETMRSILNQTYEAWHLHISVDACDDATADIARGFDDPRIEIVVQDRHLGWPGNFNWLVREVTTPFGCYWQQDDLASTSYLEDLHSELIVSPSASIAYTDVQWFGSSFERTSLPSIVGTDLMRTMSFIEDVRYEPLRGLIRMSHMPSWPDAIPVAQFESSQEEFVLLTALAAAGEFRRVASAMYFKRRHGRNTYLKWLTADRYQIRDAWLSMGTGMARIALDLAPPHQRRAILLAVLDRLTIERPGRAFWFQTVQTESELSRFVHDFTAMLSCDVGTDELLENDGLFKRVDERLAVALEAESHLHAERVNISDEIAATGRYTVSAADDPTRIYSVLGVGWSRLESWGVWSDGPAAELVLPQTVHGLSRVEIDAVCFTQAEPMVMDIRIDDQEAMAYKVAESGTAIVIEIPHELATTASRIVVRPRNPQSPRDAGLSTDERILGIGILSVSFTAVQ